MKLFAVLSLMTVLLLIFLYVQTLKKAMVPVPTKEKLAIFLFIIAFIALIWMIIGLFK
ncbi:hypothetical protein [Pueribacillus sp. YX66]|uniref:hypothetical protein n=1 Tax=Pueribacillus sp. YX66 TaxID=3229242 RepID=UPI00358D9491